MADQFAMTTAAFAFTTTPEGLRTKVLVDTIELTDSMTAAQLLTFADSIALASVMDRALVEGQFTLADTVEFDDSLYRIILITLVETHGYQDSFTLGQVLQAFADTFGLSDSFVPLAQQLISFSSTMGVEDALSLNYRIELTDIVDLTDTVIALLRDIVSIQDTVELADAFAPTFILALSISDTVAVGDNFAELVQTTLAISDTFGIVGTFRIDGELYTVWGFNPKSLGSYELKYPFNIKGFERIAGKNLIAASDGIYEISGTTDDGVSISAQMKTGMEDFNDPERHFSGEKLKQLLHAYLILTAEGETLLKVTTTRRGTLTETWFKCQEHPDAMSKKLVRLSNSLRSVLFQFELVPLKGKPAKYKELEVIPMFLSRSI